jgi:hypothetical protein
MSTIKSQTEHLTLNADGTGKDIKLQANGSEKVIIKSDGKVGIGTSSPSEKLHISGSNTSNVTLLKIENTNTTGDTGSARIEARVGGGELGWMEWERTDGAYHKSAFKVSTRGPTGSVGERLRIDTNGKVGIGTSSPDVKLQVYDTANSDPSPPGTATTGMFALNNSTQATLSIGKNSGNTYWISNVNRAFAGSYYNISLNPLGGKVGVGTTSPVQKLHVEGRIHSSTSSSSDTVVFDRYNGSGTHTIATITGTNTGLTVVARLDWVGLYAYAGTTHGAGSKIASTRRTVNGTAWGDLDNIDIGSSGNTTGFTLYWENGVLKWTINPSWQITGRISITYHNASSFVVN